MTPPTQALVARVRAFREAMDDKLGLFPTDTWDAERVWLHAADLDSLLALVEAREGDARVRDPFLHAIRSQAANLIDDCVAIHGEEAAQSAAHERSCLMLRYSNTLVTLCEAEEERRANAGGSDVR